MSDADVIDWRICAFCSSDDGVRMCLGSRRCCDCLVRLINELVDSRDNAEAKCKRLEIGLNAVRWVMAARALGGDEL